MKKTILLVFLLCGFLTQAQLVFKNRDANGSLPKFTVNQNQTEIYAVIGGKISLFHTFDQEPALYDNLDGRSRYRMTKTFSDKVAFRTFEITYTLYRQTQKYTAGIKYTIDFHDKRPTKILENYYDSL
jgi:hypothetical protein